MKTVIALTFVTALAAFLAVVPQLESQSKPKGVVMPEQGHNASLIVGADDAGKELLLPKGRRLVLQLPANPSTGYTWELVDDPKPLALETTDYVQTNNPQRIGAARVQQLKFRATGPGTAKLQLGYRRPWEKDVAPAKTFNVTVKVE